MDANTISTVNTDAPSPLATDAFGNFTAGTDNIAATPPSLKDAVSWALANLCPGDKKPDACNNFLGNDCTDFVSRALFFGGHFPTVSPQRQNHLDLDQWFYTHRTADESGTFQNALFFAEFERRYTGNSGWWHFVKSSHLASGIPVGAVIFGTYITHHPGFIDIGHTGIVTKVMGRNLMITQHSRNVTEPLWKTATQKGWFGRNITKAWVVSEQSWSFVDHNSIDCDNYADNSPCTPI